MYLILISLISVVTSLVLTLIINDLKLKKIIKTYGKDLEYISSCYISKVDSLKDSYEELLSYREKLIDEKEKQKKDIHYSNQYLKESIISFMDTLERINSLEDFYYLKHNLNKSLEIIITK